MRSDLAALPTVIQLVISSFIWSSLPFKGRVNGEASALQLRGAEGPEPFISAQDAYLDYVGDNNERWR